MTPRRTRITALASRIFDREMASGSKVMDAALRQIEVAFGNNMRINDRKLAVENAMCRGAGSIRTRQEYGEIAFAVLPDVDQALAQVNRLYRSALSDLRVRQMSGCRLPHPSVEHRLIEARIFLRWYRRFGDRTRFPGIVEALTTGAMFAVAAE